MQSKTQSKTFVKKIRLVKKIRISNDFLIGARIESFILGKGFTRRLKTCRGLLQSWF